MDGDSGDEDNDVAVIVKQTNFTLFHSVSYTHLTLPTKRIV